MRSRRQTEPTLTPCVKILRNYTSLRFLRLSKDYSPFYHMAQNLNTFRMDRLGGLGNLPTEIAIKAQLESSEKEKAHNSPVNYDFIKLTDEQHTMPGLQKRRVWKIE